MSDNFALSFGAVVNLLVVFQILQLLECHPTDITGDHQTPIVDPHVGLVLVRLDKFLTTEVAGVFVPGLTLVDDGHVILQTLFVAVGETTVAALISFALNMFGLVHLA